ncbi:lysophospholipid acyltransferase family protein [Fulvivirga lutimaris]|uniref:lysophospholipid acyltransferase family protein n=1 Tax=Fulvivirga lutimaris TaxID=1819566 RepID=UPI0012BC9283|nr:lysophospholipid acyltransferase family protein [Fulvivirga lutimaris]MTI40174.1 lipid A biosynthesis acyltransferase [Fulvivirga lutimaris]
MSALLYYLLLPLIYLVSWSPFWLLYAISSGVYGLMFHVIGYRKKVVKENLRNAFPDKTETEISAITKKYYKYLCDLIFETLKTVTWNERDVHKRVKMHDVELMDKLYEQGRSIVIVMGHLGNWEWAGPGFSLNYKHQLYVVYQPLSNKYFERIFSGSRTKFNTKIVPRKDTLRSMISNKKTISATALIADQAPTPVKTAVWMDFLNQDTPVFNGPEKIAKMLDYAVVYMDVQRVKRGYYEVVPTLLFDEPKESDENEITTAFNKKLEEGIKERPETWLWSHRRWKHKRPVN